MPRTYADISALVSNKLADSAVSEFPAADVNYQIEESLKELSEHFPHTFEAVYKVESRYGVPSSTSASALIDATKGQFLSADSTDQKVVYNASRQTWAVITGFTSTAQVGLSADIFPNTTDSYYIFNRMSRNSKQVYVGGMIEISEPVKAEYPANYWPRNWRNIRWEQGGKVLEFDIDFAPDDSDSDTSNYAARLDVLVEFSKPHILSQLTDWAGALSASALISATALALTSLQSAGTIEEGEEITIPGHRSTYIVVADTTIASNTATVEIQPPLERAANTATVINFTKSSLTPQLEDILADHVAAKLAINHGMKFANSISIGGGNVWRNYTEWGQAKLDETMRKINRESTWNTYTSYSRG
mgnify:CR=1 FL=1